MAEIGIHEADITLRSAAALARVKGRIAAGDVAGARSLLPQVVSPDHLRSLYIDRRYEAIWPATDTWADPGFWKHQRTYLETLRSEWQAAEDYPSGAQYARMLRSAGADREVVDIFLPRLSAISRDAEGVELLAEPVAKALHALGRGDDAIALLTRIEKLMPEAPTSALNLSGNRASIQLSMGLWREAAATARLWLESARKIGPEVNDSAVWRVTSVKACALIADGKAAEAAAEAAMLELAASSKPATAYAMLACRGDIAEARRLVIDQLQREPMREWALEQLQPTGLRPETPYATNCARSTMRSAWTPKSARRQPRSGVSCPSHWVRNCPPVLYLMRRRIARPSRPTTAEARRSPPPAPPRAIRRCLRSSRLRWRECRGGPQGACGLRLRCARRPRRTQRR